MHYILACMGSYEMCLMPLFSSTDFIYFDLSLPPGVFLNIPQRTCLDLPGHLLSSGESDSDRATRSNRYVTRVCFPAVNKQNQCSFTTALKLQCSVKINHQIPSLPVKCRSQHFCCLEHKYKHIILQNNSC